MSLAFKGKKMCDNENGEKPKEMPWGSSSLGKGSQWLLQNLCHFPLGSDWLFVCQFLQAIFWRRQWHPTPVLLPGKSHGRRSLIGCNPWGRYESDTTERLHFDFSLSCIGEGNGNPFQCSCLENPRDGGAWWAAVYGVAQSRTWLKQLSSSSSYRKNLQDFVAESWRTKRKGPRCHLRIVIDLNIRII